MFFFTNFAAHVSAHLYKAMLHLQLLPVACEGGPLVQDLPRMVMLPDNHMKVLETKKQVNVSFLIFQFFLFSLISG